MKKQVYLYGGTITIKKRLHISICDDDGEGRKCVIFFLKRKDAEKAYGKENVIKVELVR